jgi:cytochrome b6-f complex iron-sulfur subunit
MAESNTQTDLDSHHEEAPDRPGDPQRRWFLQWSFFGLVLAAAGMAANVVIRYLMPTPAKLREAKELTIPVAQVAKGSAISVQYQNQPVIVLHTDQGITAFNATCTHLGCLVKWLPQKNEFLCPCHAGRFSPTGQVLGGPPPEPLHRIDIEIRDNQIHFV